MQNIILDAPSLKSVIRCGAGTFKQFARELKDAPKIIVTDANVYAYYRYDMWEYFGQDVPICIITPGEGSKNLRNLTNILKFMVQNNMRRNGVVIAFGGGVIGDIAGLSASLYMRGVRLVQIPTTLLAQVDSSVGGKTAIDFEGVKNIIGTFYQPEEVIADPRFLSTLPPREMRCGLGEIVKYGALDGQILKLLEAHSKNLFDIGFLEELTALCVRHKAAVVTEDEHDLNGKRKSLNLGHTTGHALELYYRKKSHGEYVLAGMFYELYIAQKMGICPQEYAQRLKVLILSVLGETPVFKDISKAAALAKFDKKNNDANISLIVPKDVGCWQELKLAYGDYVNLLTECAKLAEGSNA